MTAFQCSKVIRCIVASRVMPALLTSTSIGPSVASIAFTPSAQAAKSETSNLNTGMPVAAAKSCAFRPHRDPAADTTRTAGDHSHPRHRLLPLTDFAGRAELSERSARYAGL